MIARPQRPQATAGVHITSGTDLIHVKAIDLTNNNSVTMGDVVMDFGINPRHFIGSRLCQESNLWSRWKPVSLKVRAVPSATSLVAGSYVMGWSANPSESFRNGILAIQKTSSLVPNRAGHISTALEFNVPLETSRKWYMCQGPPDDSSHGKLVAVLTAPISGYNQGKIGLSFYLDWKIAFEGPDFPEEIVDVVGDSVCSTGQKSSGSTNGKIILWVTGGSGGRFTASGMKRNTLYRIGTNAEKILYYTSSTDTDPSGKAKYFMMLRSSDDPDGWVHVITDLDKAILYIDGGALDITMMPKFFKDGPTTTGRPVFLEILGV